MPAQENLSSSVPVSGRLDPSAPGASFDCPRCGRPTSERFYGPCSTCRGELVAAAGREPTAVEPTAYEPRMNVVPNHVATKD